MSSRKARALGALAGAGVGCASIAFAWGFTVDDALITARVAAHLARGAGYRFNEGGPVVDAVTPLGFAYLLAPASHGTALGAFYFAKWLGAISGVFSCAWLGAAIAAERGKALRFGVLAPLALSLPLAAWCASGMETGVIVGLATLALSNGRFALAAAGLAAAWRPETLPWAVALTAGRALARRSGPREVALAVAAAVAPAIGVIAVRFVAFGHPWPLAVWAKPSDFAHGSFYAAAALIWTGAPFLVIAPRTLRSMNRHSHAILAASLAHVMALVVVGGDWMALFRLFVPVLPGLYLVGARVTSRSAVVPSLVRLLGASAVSALLLHDKGEAARGVLAQRLELVRGLGPVLSRSRRVAALDVGWVGAATDREVVDLAGVTDESVARLPGGHTSKRLPEQFLESRHVDALVLLARGPVPEDYRDARWDRAVEARVVNEAARLGFAVRATLELRGTPDRYVVLEVQDSLQWSETTRE